MNDFTKAFRMSCSVFPELNWLAIVLIVFVAFSWLMTLALCRAARLGDEMSARLADERRAAQQREEERP